MDIENTSRAACSECGALDHLADVLDNMGVEYTIQHAA